MKWATNFSSAYKYNGNKMWFILLWEDECSVIAVEWCPHKAILRSPSLCQEISSIPYFTNVVHIAVNFHHWSKIHFNFVSYCICQFIIALNILCNFVECFFLQYSWKEKYFKIWYFLLCIHTLVWQKWVVILERKY